MCLVTVCAMHCLVVMVALVLTAHYRAAAVLPINILACTRCDTSRLARSPAPSVSGSRQGHCTRQNAVGGCSGSAMDCRHDRRTFPCTWITTSCTLQQHD